MPYTVDLKPPAKRQYAYWKKRNARVADKIDELLEAMETDPFRGIGKPEPLKGAQHGFWSRRITEEHRMVYDVEGDRVVVYGCYGHY